MGYASLINRVVLNDDSVNEPTIGGESYNTITSR
jgi:hypothetical protein